MILYFSATGNCKYVAARLASAFGQETVSIVDCIQGSVYSFADDTIGVVVPTYFWGLPSIVKEFLEKVDFHADYFYFIATYGTTPGASDAMAGKAIRGKTIDAFYSVRRFLTCPRRRKWRRFPEQRKRRSTMRSARSANAIPTGI